MSALEVEYHVQETERAISLAELPQDELNRHRAERFIKRVGETAVRLVEVSPVTEPDRAPTLMHALHDARKGNINAAAMIMTNATSDGVERIHKTGNVIEVEIGIDEQGRHVQFGQISDDIQTNNLRYASDSPVMLKRSEAEVRNKFRLEYCEQNGLLEDNYLVVMSMAAKKLNRKQLTELGFFADTMTAVFQATTKNEHGNLALSSAFVSGVTEPDGERHDTQAIVAMAQDFGVNYEGKTETEIIDMPLLIPKSLMPNGVIDLVKLYDQKVGGTFFGQAKPVEDYGEYLEFCRKRTADIIPTVKKVVEHLLREADSITTPIQAVQRLHELSQQYFVDRAVEDETINPLVFGTVAAEHIVSARLHYSQGNVELAQVETRRAQATAQSGSCPTKTRRDGAMIAIDGIINEDSGESNDETESTASKIRCIKCRDYVDKILVVKKDCWECPSCKYKVDICNGTILEEGTYKNKVVSLLDQLIVQTAQKEKVAA